MNPATDCRVAVLGPVQLAAAGSGWVDVPGVNGKALIVSLVLARGAVVSVPSLVDDIWQDEPPRNAKAALQTLVSRVRATAGDELIESVGGGYRLAVPVEQVDLWATDAARRGEPGADLGDTELASRLRRAADAVRAAHLAARATAELASGDTHAAVADARLLAGASPYDEEAQLLLMRALAAAGRQGDALRSFAQFRARLADELGTDPGQALTAFNTELLREADGASTGPGEAAHRTPSGGTAAEPPAVRPARPARPAEGLAPRAIGLRAAPNALIGRDTDTAAIEELMQHARVTTVLGAGGLGKTRLAQELARRAHERGTTQVVVVELAGIREHNDVPLAVASALGIGETSTGRLRLSDPLVLLEVRSRIVAALSEQPTLLVLDNCEHVVEAAAYLVGEILAAVPTVTMLATSRAPLQIAAESVYPLEPLAADAHGPAVQLFLERARAARPAAQLPPEVVGRLCARLDGLPLAIELAAARIRSMTVDEIERRLGNRFALLSGGDRSAPERHRTLLAVIDWSWNLLGDGQRRLLRRLSRFPDGFPAEAAIAVAGGDPLEAADDLEALVGQSLVTLSETPDGDARYRMLETVREFGDRVLVDAGEVELVADAMAAWARGFAGRVLVDFQGAGQAPAMRRLELEYENLLGVLRRAIDPERPDPDTVYPVYGTLVLLWMVHNQLRELLAFAWPVAQAVAQAPVPEGSLDGAAITLLVSAVMGISAGRMPESAVAEMTGRGIGSDDGPTAEQLTPQARAQGYRTGLRLGVRARRLAREHPVSPWLGAVMHLLSSARSVPKGRIELERLRSSDDLGVRTLAYMFSGFFTENSGDLDAARRFALTAFAGAEQLGSAWTAGQAAQNLAHLASQTDRPEEALHWAAVATERFLQLGAVEEVRQLDWVLAVNRLKLGTRTDAPTVFEDFTTQEAGQPGFDALDVRAIGWSGLAELAAVEGRLDDAVELYRRAAAVFAGGPRTQRMSAWFQITQAAAIAQAVAAGRLGDQERREARALRTAARVALRLRGGAETTDRPVFGAALSGIAAWLLGPRDDATDAERADGLALFALAEGLHGRQDQPVLVHARLAALAASVVGADALTAARRTVAALDLDARAVRGAEVLARVRI